LIGRLSDEVERGQSSSSADRVAVQRIWTFFVGLELPAAPLVNLAPVVIGIIAMILHGILVIRRVTSGRQKGITD
jgi:hypothetical protein